MALFQPFHLHFNRRYYVCVVSVGVGFLLVCWSRFTSIWINTAVYSTHRLRNGSKDPKCVFILQVYFPLLYKYSEYMLGFERRSPKCWWFYSCVDMSDINLFPVPFFSFKWEKTSSVVSNLCPWMVSANIHLNQSAANVAALLSADSQTYFCSDDTRAGVRAKQKNCVDDWQVIILHHENSLCANTQASYQSASIVLYCLCALRNWCVVAAASFVVK